MPITRNESLHTFTMKEAFAHEDEGSTFTSPTAVRAVMENAKKHFPGIVTTHQLARSLDVILSKKGFDKEKTLLATSLCCDEVCRDMEDELRQIYGQNFSFGGIGGFPFGGSTAFGTLCHHVPTDGGTCLIVYASHVGIDYDGVIGKVNRKGHSGSGYCCNTAMASLAYCRAVNEGRSIHSPDPSDPIDAQQVFVDSALMKHSDRLLNAEHPELELPHVMNDCQAELLHRIMDKCVIDIAKGTKIALLGGVQVNCGEGLPDYFLPKRFSLCNSKGEILEDLLQDLIHEGNRSVVEVLRQQKLDKLMAAAKKDTIEVPIVP